MRSNEVIKREKYRDAFFNTLPINGKINLQVVYLKLCNYAYLMQDIVQRFIFDFE